MSALEKVLAAPRTDSALIARLGKGDEHAFNELVEQHHGALIRMALRHVKRRDVAEEVVQDTWIDAIDGIKRFEGRSAVSTWLFSVLIRKAKDRGVRESKLINIYALESSDEDGGEEAVDPSRFHAVGDLAGHWALPPRPWDEHTPERLLASKQAFAALSKAIDELPKGLRDVLILKDMEGLETGQICERLHITETHLYVRLHRARERLRVAVEMALSGQPPRNVSNCSLSTLMATAYAIRRKPCPGKTMSTGTHAGA